MYVHIYYYVRQDRDQSQGKRLPQNDQSRTVLEAALTSRKIILEQQERGAKSQLVIPLQEPSYNM